MKDLAIHESDTKLNFKNFHVEKKLCGNVILEEPCCYTKHRRNAV